jgi:hypothetical protein
VSARTRHSGMFLAGIQGKWQLDPVNRMAGLLNNYPFLNILKRDEQVHQMNKTVNKELPTT